MAEVWVEIWHPEIEGTTLRTLTSFKKLHESKGWQLVEDEPESDTSNAVFEDEPVFDVEVEEDEISDE